MGPPRRAQTCPYDQVNVVHCINGCVRRGYLRGTAPYGEVAPVAYRCMNGCVRRGYLFGSAFCGEVAPVVTLVITEIALASGSGRTAGETRLSNGTMQRKQEACIYLRQPALLNL